MKKSVLVLWATTLLVGCPDNKETHPGSINVTALLNTSGRLASIGEPTQRALEAFAWAVNESQAPYKIEVSFENAGSDPTRAAEAVTEALNSHSRPDILISSTSGTTMAILPYITGEGVLLLANAGHPGIVSGDATNTLLAFPAPNDECEVIIEEIDSRIIDGKAETATAFLIRTSDVYHDMDAVELRERLGDRLVGDERYSPGDQDFTSIVRRIESSDPDVVVVMGFGISYRSLLQELVSRNSSVQILFDTDFLSRAVDEYPREMWPFIQFVGTDALRMDSQYPSTLAVAIDRYRQDYAELPKYFAVILLDALHVALQEFERDVDVETLIERIEGRAEERLASGLVRFEERQIRISLRLFKIDDTGLPLPVVR